MYLKIIEERAKQALSNSLPDPCGKNCPIVCCDPIVTGFFMEKELLNKETDYKSAIEFLESTINKTLDLKTSDNKKCFLFEGIILTNIDTDYGFVEDSELISLIENKLNVKLPESKIQFYLSKIKEKFREVNIGILTVFKCINYDYENNKCTIYSTRPQLCRTYSCEQLEPDKINYSYDEILKRISVKKEQRDYIFANIKSTPLEAINFYLNNNNNT